MNEAIDWLDRHIAQLEKKQRKYASYGRAAQLRALKDLRWAVRNHTVGIPEEPRFPSREPIISVKIIIYP